MVSFSPTSIRHIQSANQLKEGLFNAHIDWERSQEFWTHERHLTECNCHICYLELEMSPVYSVKFYGMTSKMFIWICLPCWKKIHLYGWWDKDSPLNIHPKST